MRLSLTLSLAASLCGCTTTSGAGDLKRELLRFEPGASRREQGLEAGGHG